MKKDELMSSFFKYYLRDGKYASPLDIFAYKKEWDDWRITNKIALKESLMLWDEMTNLAWVEKRIPDGYTEKDYKQLCEEIRLLKIECDF